MELVIDTRESKVIPFFEEEYVGIIITVKQINIGDYAIYRGDTLLFIIERKTWQDLAASIKDGRKENVKKLLLAREETGCKIIYLIEGKARCSPTKKFARIPYKNLQAHLDHLIIRDNVYVIYSSSYEDTAHRLIEFINNYLSLNIAIESSKKIGGDFDLTKKIPKDDLQITYKIWSCVPNITEKTASLFLSEGQHISDLVLGEINEADIYTMKYPNGTIIGKRASKISKITEVTPQNKKIYANMLTCINGLTKKTADIILNKVDFKDILNGTVSIEELAAIQKTEKTKLGKKISTEILKYFSKSEESLSEERQNADELLD